MDLAAAIAQLNELGAAWEAANRNDAPSPPAIPPGSHICAHAYDPNCAACGIGDGHATK